MADGKTKKGYNPKSAENLVPFEPGKVTNPKGRGKGKKNLSTILKRFIEASNTRKNPTTGKKIKKTAGEWVCLNLIAKAMAGDTRAIKLIFDRLEGKVAENLNVKVDDSSSMEAIKAKMYERRENQNKE